MHQRTGTLVQDKFKEHLPSTVMTSLAMSLASVIDSMIVGNLLGDTALAAVGLAAPIIFLINLIYMLFGVGGLTCASIAKGEHNQTRANQIFTFTLLGGLASMLVYVAIITAFASPISLALTGGDVALAQLTAAYIRPLVWTGPALLFSSGTALFLRMDGNPKGAAHIVLIANAVNLILDYVLIRFLHAGIMGAGLSTTLGYICGSVVVIRYFLSPKRTFRLQAIPLHALSLSRDVFLKGLPKALNQATSFVRAIVLNGIILQALGAIGLSIMVVCTNLQMVAGIFVGGTSDALLPIVGGLFGEQDYFGIRKVIKQAFAVLMTCCVVLSLCILAVPQVVAAMFGLTSPDTADIVQLSLRLFALYIPLYGINTLLQNLYTATKREKLAMMISTLDGAVYVLTFALFYATISVNWLWLCFSSAGLCTLGTVLLLAIRIRKKEGVAGILLLKQVADDIVWDMTIQADQTDAASLSAQTIDFCAEQGISAALSNRLGLVVEEMAVHIAKTNQNKGWIDVRIRILPSEIVVRFRDNGEAYDPTIPQQSPCSELEIVQKIASNLDYIQQMGFNSTVLTLQIS